MARDTLQQLSDAGVAVDALSEAERQVFADLSEQDSSVILSLQQRLNDAKPEVTGLSLLSDTNNNLC
jgi:hypothetical protein